MGVCLISHMCRERRWKVKEVEERRVKSGGGDKVIHPPHGCGGWRSARWSGR